MKDIRIGFMDMRGLWSTFHQVLAIAENFETSSDDTELFKALLVLSRPLLLLLDTDEDDEKAYVGYCWYDEFSAKEQLPKDDVTSALFLRHCPAL